MGERRDRWAVDAVNGNKDFRRGGDRWAFVLDWIDQWMRHLKSEAPTSGTAIFREVTLSGDVRYSWSCRGKEVELVVSAKWGEGCP